MELMFGFHSLTSSATMICCMHWSGVEAFKHAAAKSDQDLSLLLTLISTRTRSAIPARDGAVHQHLKAIQGGVRAARGAAAALSGEQQHRHAGTRAMLPLCLTHRCDCCTPCMTPCTPLLIHTPPQCPCQCFCKQIHTTHHSNRSNPRRLSCTGPMPSGSPAPQRVPLRPHAAGTAGAAANSAAGVQSMATGIQPGIGSPAAQPDQLSTPGAAATPVRLAAAARPRTEAPAAFHQHTSGPCCPASPAAVPRQPTLPAVLLCL